MNKKVIPFAVAAALAAPLAAQAEVTIYGKAMVSFDAVDVDGSGEDRQYKVVGNQPIASVPHADRIGFKGSEDLGDGLKAIWKMEFSADQANNSAVNSSRNAYVGLAGDWGTGVMGRHDTPYKMSMGKYDYFSDQLGDFNGTVGFQDLRTQNTVAYISPAFGGFTFSGAFVSPGSDNFADAWSVGGMYTLGGINVSLAYEGAKKDFAEANGIAEDKWSIGGSWDIGPFGIAGRYEGQGDDWGFEDENNDPFDSDVNNWQVSGKYSFGNNDIKGMYGQNRPDEGDNVNTWGIGFDHNFSKRSQLFVQWVDKEDNWDGFSLGMSHNF